MMKDNGVRQDDPEYIKAFNLLSAISQQANYRKQKAQQQQEMMARSRQAMQQQAAANAQSTANGVNGRKHSVT